MNPLRIILGSIAAMIVAFVIYRAADAVYLQPKQALLQSIKQQEESLEVFRTARNAHIATDDALQEAANRTLGETREVVEAELRSRLNQIAAEVNLRGAVVSTGSAVAVRTPARRQLDSRNPFRDEPDFVEVPGTISGVGDWRQVLALIDRVQNASWVWRVDSVTLDPEAQGEPFSVRLQLTTIYFPGRPPEEPPASRYQPDPQMLAMASTNIFKLPTPPEPQQPVEVAQQETAEEQESPQPPPPPPFDYSVWRLTMVTQSGRGAEAWVLNTKSGERRTLASGDRLHEMVFESATTDDAAFNLNNQLCRVTVGASLAEQQPVPDTETPADTERD